MEGALATGSHCPMKMASRAKEFEESEVRNNSKIVGLERRERVKE